MVSVRVRSALAALFVLLLAGCGGETAGDLDVSRPDTPSAKTTPAASGDVDDATCAEIGGNAEFPDSSGPEAGRVARTVAADYTEKFGQSQNIVAGGDDLVEPLADAIEDVGHFTSSAAISRKFVQDDSGDVADLKQARIAAREAASSFGGQKLAACSKLFGG